MANELTHTQSFNYSKSGDTFAISHSHSVTVSAAPRASGVISVRVSGEAVPLGDVSTVGWVNFQNLDSTNYVDIGNGAGSQMVIRLKAGESAGWRHTGAQIYAAANTAAVNVAYRIWSD